MEGGILRPGGWREGEGKTRLKRRERSEGEKRPEKERPGEAIIVQSWAWG